MLSSGPLVGTPEQIAERLAELNGLGMTYPILNLADVAYDRSGLELLTEKVLPALA
jgi:alkanesulfonate monooxygenase SsuD/methylene tetrahydromethanopterin reductase-like flavin-dependent oxidoreductase (luciferase family)